MVERREHLRFLREPRDAILIERERLKVALSLSKGDAGARSEGHQSRDFD
jgi:hypothetical protein